MRTFFEKPNICSQKNGRVYICSHELYTTCTLFEDDYGQGLAVIQQRFDEVNKTTRWTAIDIWLNDELYENPYFKDYFDKKKALPMDGIYPTVTIRQIMNALKMKPLRKEKWETVFDRPVE